MRRLFDGTGRRDLIINETPMVEESEETDRGEGETVDGSGCGWQFVEHVVEDDEAACGVDES